MVEVHLVLNELDDGKDEVGVAQPAEHIVEDAHVFVFYAAGDAVAEGREHHAGNVGHVGLHVACHVEGVVVGGAGHANHQVDAGLAHHGLGLLHGAHLCERWRIAQAQGGVFIENLLVNAAVVLQHEGIVGVGHDKHVEDAPRHQVHKRHVLQVELVPLLGNAVFHLFSSCGSGTFTL